MPRVTSVSLTMPGLPRPSANVRQGQVYGTVSGTLTSLYAPEIRLSASFSAALPGGILVQARIDNDEMRVIPISGCSLSRDQLQTILFNGTADIEFCLAEPWDEPANEDAAPSAMRAFIKAATKGFLSLITSTLRNIYPFQSRLIELKFSAPDADLSTSLRLEIPHYLTRYTIDTRSLQHIFVERGLRAPSILAGIAGGGQAFQFHLHYKSLDVFRRISTPILTMIWVFLLDLAVLESIPADRKWSSTPLALLAFLSINAGAFGSLAAIRIGSTIRSLLNVVRFVALVWIILLTAAIRAVSIPFFGTHLETIIDWGLKASIVWLVVTGFFSFGPYALEQNRDRRLVWLWSMTMLGAVVSLAMSFGPWKSSFEAVRTFVILLNASA